MTIKYNLLNPQNPLGTLDPFGTKNLFADINKTNQQINSMNLPQPKEKNPYRQQYMGNMLLALSDVLKGNNPGPGAIERKALIDAQKKEAERKAAIEAFLNTPEGSKYKEAYKLKDLLGIDISKFSKSGRKIIKGADGFNYYEDTKERVLPGVEIIASGNKETSLIQNAAALTEKRKRYAAMSDDEKQSIDGKLLLQEINDFAGLGGALKYDPRTAFDVSASKEAGKQGVSFGDGPLTTGEVATDKNFANFYKDYLSKGRGAKNVANVERLDDAKTIMKYAAQNGIPISSVPFSLVAQRPSLSAFFSPEGVMAQERVASVIQQSLKEILGGQFAEREGIALIQRGYNPALNPEENLERLLDLEAQVLQIVESEQDAVEYYENNNMSLRGYKGKRYTADDFVRDLETEYTIDVRKLSEEELEDVFLEANDDSLWESTIEKEIKRRLKKKK